MLTVTIPGTPQQQGSKRNVGKFSIEANKNLAPWRADAIHLLQKAMAEQLVQQFTGPVFVTATFAYARPKGHYGTGRNAAVVKDSAPLFKATAPDADKLARALGDALTQAGVVRDDCLIAGWLVRKVWAATPGVRVIVSSGPQPAFEETSAMPVIVGRVTDEVRKLHREEVSVFYRRDLAGDDYSETYPWCVVCGLAYPCSTVRLLDSLDAEAGRVKR